MTLREQADRNPLTAAPTRIILDCDGKGWSAHFAAGNPWGMPAQWLPLPFTDKATGAMVRDDLRRRFPGASVVGVWQ